MGVEDPGTLQVTCDDCSDETDMDTTAYIDGNGASYGVSEETMEENGWLQEGSGLGVATYCPKCRKEYE